MNIDPNDIGKSKWLHTLSETEEARLHTNIEEHQFVLIRRDIRFLEDIPNPTPAVQLEAITSYPGLIFMIKRPTKEVQAIAFADDPNNVIDVKYPNKKLIEQYFDHPELMFPAAQHIYFSTNQKYIKAFLLMRWNVDEQTMRKDYFELDDNF